jgi:hypothetical protein
VVIAFLKTSSVRRLGLIHSVCKKYSIKSLERDYKHYYFIIRGDNLIFFNSCLDNGEHYNRADTVSFFAPYSLNQHYQKFTKNIGGEICEFGLRNAFPNVYDKLTSNGYPVTVRFAYKFSDVADFRKDNIALEFIRYYASKLFIGHEYTITFDAVLTKSVEPYYILEIIDYIDEMA